MSDNHQDDLPQAGADDSQKANVDSSNLRFVITNVVFLLLALVTAYLEYVVYSSVISGDFPNFGEHNVSLNLSVLTFQYDATRCYGSSTNCPRLQGVQSLDFFQIFVLAIVFYNLVHFINSRKSRDKLSVA